MFNQKKSPLNPKQKYIQQGFGGYPNSNPFDSDDETTSSGKDHNAPPRTSPEPALTALNLGTNPFDDENKGPRKSTSLSNNLEKRNKYKNDFRGSGRLENKTSSEKVGNAPPRASPEPALTAPKLGTNPFDYDNKGPRKSNSIYSNNLEKRNKYKDDFRDVRGLENRSVQELEKDALHEAEETTKTVNSCLKIAEDIREDATKTLVHLHQQGEQISKAHSFAVDIDNDLSRGEKLLASLGGLFSRTWKPTKMRTISGPVITRDDPVQRMENHLEQRERLGLSVSQKGRPNTRTSRIDPTNILQKVELEKDKQDGTLSDLSNLLDELKDMAVDMGSEIDRQNKALVPFVDDVDELNFRVRGANQRGRRLLGK